MPHKKDIAEALLEAHVRYAVEQLSGPGLAAALEEELDATLAAAAHLTLGDVAQCAAVQQTLREAVGALEYGPGIATLVRAVAGAIHQAPVHDATTPDALLATADVARIVDQALALAELREALVRGIVASPVYTALASDLLYHGIRGYLAENAVTRNIPGAQSVMKLGRAALNKATPRLEATLEEGLKKYIAQAVRTTSARSVDFLLEEATTQALRHTALQAWDAVGATPIGALRQRLSRHQTQDVADVGRQTWEVLRGSDYLGALLDAAVAAFFAEYEHQRLEKLIDDLGLTRERLLQALLRHTGPLMKSLKKKKLLEALLRRRLRGFYLSGQVEAVLSRHKE